MTETKLLFLNEHIAEYRAKARKKLKQINCYLLISEIVNARNGFRNFNGVYDAKGQ